MEPQRMRSQEKVHLPLSLARSPSRAGGRGRGWSRPPVSRLPTSAAPNPPPRARGNSQQPRLSADLEDRTPLWVEAETCSVMGSSALSSTRHSAWDQHPWVPAPWGSRTQEQEGRPRSHNESLPHMSGKVPRVVWRSRPPLTGAGARVEPRILCLPGPWPCRWGLSEERGSCGRQLLPIAGASWTRLAAGEQRIRSSGSLLPGAGVRQVGDVGCQLLEAWGLLGQEGRASRPQPPAPLLHLLEPEPKRRICWAW